MMRPVICENAARGFARTTYRSHILRLFPPFYPLSIPFHVQPDAVSTNKHGWYTVDRVSPPGQTNLKSLPQTRTRPAPKLLLTSIWG